MRPPPRQEDETRQTVKPIRLEATAPDVNRGWWYNSATGEFRSHTPDAIVIHDATPANAL